MFIDWQNKLSHPTHMICILPQYHTVRRTVCILRADIMKNLMPQLQCNIWRTGHKHCTIPYHTNLNNTTIFLMHDIQWKTLYYKVILSWNRTRPLLFLFLFSVFFCCCCKCHTYKLQTNTQQLAPFPWWLLSIAVVM